MVDGGDVVVAEVEVDDVDMGDVDRVRGLEVVVVQQQHHLVLLAQLGQLGAGRECLQPSGGAVHHHQPGQLKLANLNTLLKYFLFFENIFTRL